MPTVVLKLTEMAAEERMRIILKGARDGKIVV
jgi:hypothetical protein